MSKIDVTEHKIYSDKITIDANLTIVQLSDLHPNPGDNNSKLIKLIEDASPDIVVATGDMLNIYDEKIDITLNFLKEISKKHPVYYVYGNHEIYNKYFRVNEIEQKLLEVGVKVLNNSGISISKNIHMCGISYQKSNICKFSDRSKEFLETLSEKEYNILLAHNPDCFEVYSNYNTDLTLSGHIHGGEIRIFGKGLLSPRRTLFPKYSAGVYNAEKSDKKMIVSRGLGDYTFKLRINNNPEIVVIKLIGRNTKTF